MAQQMKKFYSTVNGLQFSVPADEEKLIGFFKHPTVQPFIVEQSGNLAQQLAELEKGEAEKAVNPLGEIEIVQPEDEPQVEKKARKPRQAKPVTEEQAIELE